MADAIDSNDSDRIRDLVKNAVVSHANPPIAGGAGELLCSGRAWIGGQRGNAFDDAVVDLVGKPAEILFRRAFEDDLKHALCGARPDILSAAETRVAWCEPALNRQHLRHPPNVRSFPHTP